MTFMPEGPRRGAVLAGLALLASPPLFAAALADAPRPAQAPPSAYAPSIEAARAALRKGDGVAAEMDLRRAADAGVPTPEIAALMGEAYLIQGDLAAARQWLAPGDFAPGDRRYGFHMLARLELAEGDFPAAEAAFAHALEGNPGTAEIWVDIGRMRYRDGQHHLALAASLKALELDPAYPAALEFRGQLARDGQGLAAALPWFEKGLKSAPDNLSLLGEYAATLGELGRAKEMLVVTRRMIELDAQNPRAFYLQAVLAARAGDYNLARRLMWRTQGAFDQLPAAMMLEGILEMQEGNWSLAVEAFDELSRLQPDNLRITQLLGRALLENGDAREVIARYSTLVQRSDASPYMLTLVGRAYEQLGDRAAAAVYLDRAAMPPPTGISTLPVDDAGELAIFRWGSDPYRLDAAVPKVRKALAAGDSVGAARIVALLGQRYGDSADVQVLSGDVALARGQAGLALENYRSAAQIRLSFALLIRMAAAFRQLGQDGAARALVSDYLAQHPQDADAAKLLAEMMADKGDWRRVGLLLDHVRTLHEAGRDPRLLGLLAQAQLALGDVPRAETQAATAYGMQRSNGRSALILARVLRQAGRTEEAGALFAKAARLGFADM